MICLARFHLNLNGYTSCLDGANHLLQTVVPHSGLSQLFRGDERPFQQSPVQLSLAQIRPAQISSCEVGIGEIGISEIGLAYIRSAQIGPTEVRPGEIDFTQVGLAQVSSVQLDRCIGMLFSPPVPDSSYSLL